MWTYFTPFSSVSIVDFEQENVRWVGFSRITEGMFAYFAVLIGEATDRFPDWEVLSFFLCYMTFCNQEPKTCETCFDLLFIHRKPEEKLLGIPFQKMSWYLTMTWSYKVQSHLASAVSHQPSRKDNHALNKHIARNYMLNLINLVENYIWHVYLSGVLHGLYIFYLKAQSKQINISKTLLILQKKAKFIPS